MPANPTSTATLELNAIDNVTAVLKTVKAGVGSLSDEYNKLVGVVQSAAAAIGLFKLTEWVGGAIEGVAKLREMAIATGVAVETLSGLRLVAKQAGADMDQVASMVQKLSRNMFEFAETGQGKAAVAFERLGFTQA